MSNVNKFRPIIATDFIREMTDRGLVPHGTTRILIDSGAPGGVVRVFWSGFADQEMLQALMEKVMTDDLKLAEEESDNGESVR